MLCMPCPVLCMPCAGHALPGPVPALLCHALSPCREKALNPVDYSLVCGPCLCVRVAIVPTAAAAVVALGARLPSPKIGAQTLTTWLTLGWHVAGEVALVADALTWVPIATGDNEVRRVV